MNFASIDDVRHSGFDGFVTVSALQASKCCEVPKKPGVYLVLRPTVVRPAFLEASIGGFFKGKNPTVALVRLESKWVESAVVLYIGKAGPRTATLKSRLWQYVRFGQGQAVSHWGGRYIWQLADSCDLLVCWKITIEAVKKWQYKPFLVNGQTVEVKTEIEVPFSLGISEADYKKEQDASDAYFKQEDKCRALLRAKQYGDAESSCRTAVDLVEKLPAARQNERRSA
jgi:hypothetical protein